MTYVDRPQLPKGPPWAHNSLGASVHNALRSWFELPPDLRTPTGAAGLLATGWLTEGFRDREQSEAAKARATGWLTSYVEDVDPGFDPVGLERTVATTTERLAVSGRVDRIDQRGEELVIVDYKTGRSPLSSDDTRGSRALALYALAARRTLRRPCTRVELHHLPTGSVHAHEHTDESLARHVRRAEDTAADIVAATGAVSAGAEADEVFRPTPGPMCSWCDWRRHCPEGQAAAPPKDPWVAVE
jgi:RecB family exonuclease